MEKTLSSNQASLIFCIFTIGLKLSALPSLISGYAGNDSYMVCLIALIFDFIGTFIILTIMHKNPDKTFTQILKEAFGKPFAIIINSILLLYFIAKCILVLQELHDYFIATLFEELNPVFFIIVLGLLIFYTTTKNFRTVGRLAELIFWPTFIGIVFSLIFPIEDIQLEKLLPLFTQGPYPMYQAMARTTFAFGDYMILLPLMGNIALNEKSKKKMLLYAVNTFGFIFNFFIIFAGSFGRFGIHQTLALGELPLHNTTPATIGKLEWLTIIIWTVVLLTDATILAMASKSSLDNIIGRSDKKWISYVLTAVIIGSVAFTYMQLETIIELATTPIFSSVSGGIQILLVTILSIANLITKKKNPPNNTPDISKHKKREVQRC
jgi:spore germination protein (amino acid permease)